MRHNFGSADNSDDSPSSSSPKGIKRKLVVSDDNNGCRRCTCTKTKCLNLYCVCFASKVLCSDSCTCQNCSNKLQYKDIVLQRVQMMESRNPVAFHSKISEPSTNNSVNGGVHHTVASARHIKGCNCKKSKCSKKYCECCQFGVGCSDRCRCEGCENVHGRKGDYSMNKNLVSNHDNNNNKILSGSYNEITNDNLLNEFGYPYDNHQMSVTAPSIPFSNHGETTQNSCVPQMPFQPSYESSSNANIIQVPNHQSSTEMVMNCENYIDHGVRPRVPFNGQLQYYGNQNTTMSSFWPIFGVPALNSANNSRLGVPALNSANNSGFGVPALNSPNNSGFGVPDLNSPNNSVVNSSIQSGGNSCVRIFSSTSKDGIPKEESPLIPVVKTPPPNKIQVSPPFGVPSSIGLKLNLSRFNPCNNFKNQENMNPNDQQNCSRRGR